MGKNSPKRIENLPLLLQKYWTIICLFWGLLSNEMKKENILLILITLNTLKTSFNSAYVEDI